VRHLKEGEGERLNMVMSLGAAMALGRLAAHIGTTPSPDTRNLAGRGPNQRHGRCDRGPASRLF
jgi:hypothetical protein